MIKYLKKEYLKENVLNFFNEVLEIDTEIENELYEMINELIYEFNNDNIEIEFEDIIELFNIETLLLNKFNHELYYDNFYNKYNDKINYKYYDNLISLFNIYDYDKIFENDPEDIKYFYGIDLNFNHFNYYNSTDNLIYYNESIDMFKTINYYDLDNIIDINYIIERIMEFENI